MHRNQFEPRQCVRYDIPHSIRLGAISLLFVVAFSQQAATIAQDQVADDQQASSDAMQPRLLRRFPEGPYRVPSIVDTAYFSTDGKQFISASWMPPIISVMEVSSGEIVKQIELPSPHSIKHMRLDSTQRYALVVRHDELNKEEIPIYLELWDLQTSERVQEYVFPKLIPNGATEVAFFGDEKFIAAMQNETLTIWKRDSGDFVVSHEFGGIAEFGKFQYLVGPRSSVIAKSGRLDLAVHYWTMNAFERAPNIKIIPLDQQPASANLSPNGSVTINTFARRRKVEDGIIVYVLKGHDEIEELVIYDGTGVSQSHLIQDGEYLLTSERRFRMRVRSGETLRVLDEIPAQRTPDEERSKIRDLLHFTNAQPSSDQFATVSSTGLVMFLGLPQLDIKSPLDFPFTSNIQYFRLLPETNEIAILTKGHVIQRWDLDTGELNSTKKLNSALGSTKLSSDGSYVARLINSRANQVQQLRIIDYETNDIIVETGRVTEFTEYAEPAFHFTNDSVLLYADSGLGLQRIDLANSRFSKRLPIVPESFEKAIKDTVEADLALEKETKTKIEALNLRMLFSEDGDRLFLYGDRSIDVFDTSSGERVFNQELDITRLISCFPAASKNELLCVFQGAPNKSGVGVNPELKTFVGKFSLETGNFVTFIPNPSGKQSPLERQNPKLSESPDGRRIYIGARLGANSSVIIDSETGAQLHAWNWQSNGALPSIWHPDGTRLITVRNLAQIEVWDVSQ